MINSRFGVEKDIAHRPYHRRGRVAALGSAAKDSVPEAATTDGVASSSQPVVTKSDRSEVGRKSATNREIVFRLPCPWRA